MKYEMKPTINGSSCADDCAACCFEETCVGHGCRAPHGYHYETNRPDQESHTPKYIEALTSPTSTREEDCAACCFGDICSGICRAAQHHHYVQTSK